MDEQVYNQYYDTGGNYHWIGVHSGEHIVWKREKMTRDEAIAHGKEQLEIFGGTHREFILMAIEALERPHGEWQVYYDEDSPQDGIWKCSICGYIRLIDDISPTRFCPNCGADTRGKDDDN